MPTRTLLLAACLAGCAGFGDPADVHTVLVDDRGQVVGEVEIGAEPAEVTVEARGLDPARAYAIATVPGASCSDVFTGDRDAASTHDPQVLGTTRAGPGGELTATVPMVDGASDGSDAPKSLVVLPDAQLAADPGAGGQLEDDAVGDTGHGAVACGAVPQDAYTRSSSGIVPRRGPGGDPSSQQMFPDDMARPPAGSGDPPG